MGPTIPSLRGCVPGTVAVTLYSVKSSCSLQNENPPPCSKAAEPWRDEHAAHSHTEGQQQSRG